jgi:hypothetical protein
MTLKSSTDIQDELTDDARRVATALHPPSRKNVQENCMAAFDPQRNQFRRSISMRQERLCGFGLFATEYRMNAIQDGRRELYKRAALQDREHDSGVTDT